MANNSNTGEFFRNQWQNPEFRTMMASPEVEARRAATREITAKAKNRLAKRREAKRKWYHKNKAVKAAAQKIVEQNLSTAEPLTSSQLEIIEQVLQPAKSIVPSLTQRDRCELVMNKLETYIDELTVLSAKIDTIAKEPSDGSIPFFDWNSVNDASRSIQALISHVNSFHSSDD